MKGVTGVFSEGDAIQKTVYVLYGVQHRGQEGSGLSAGSDISLRTWNGTGLVSNVFDKKFNSWIHPSDYIAIACASGESYGNSLYPPFEVETEEYKFSLAIDGFFLKRHGKVEETFATELKKNLTYLNLEQAIRKTMEENTEAYYSMVMIFYDKRNRESLLIAARDRKGVRPLTLAINGHNLFIASESAAIEVLENSGIRFQEKRDIIPGSFLIKRKKEIIEKQVLKPQPSFCAFEWVYFGRPDSVIEGKTVHDVRKRLGHYLVKRHNLVERYKEDHLKGLSLIPVPDSGRSVCIGVSEALNISSDEGVIKNAYMGRTYIIDDPDFRKIASDLKHNIVKKVVENKKVIITDDSIVRGTVSESIAKNLLQAGASEVEFLVSYAPIFYPCFSDQKNKPLAAAQYLGNTIEEIGNLVAKGLPSINKIIFNAPKDIVKAIGLPENNVCTYCMTGLSPFK
jgi:amidophosphoribosyltransferase